jgi:hypothetical protein
MHDLSITLEDVASVDPTTDDHTMVRRMRHASREALLSLVEGTRCAAKTPEGWHEALTTAVAQFDQRVAVSRAALEKAVAILEAHGVAASAPTGTTKVGITELSEKKAQDFAADVKKAGWKAEVAIAEGGANVVTARKASVGRIVASWKDDKFQGPGSFERKDGTTILVRNASDARKIMEGIIA